ncbi:MAG: hypothetical protein JNM62_13885 [Flavobacteriales bacterium]|nr:hypothetical protein [Flavobacteriales bacterium]
MSTHVQCQVIAVAALVAATMPVAVKGQTGAYHALPLDNGVWCMSTACTDPGCGDQGYIRTYAADDTLIDGNTYAVLVSDLLPTTAGTCCQIPMVEPIAYIREDSSARKVYLRTDLITSDSLLYDFSLQVGDTLKGYLGATAALPLVVLSIDSALVDGAYHKRLNFDTSQACLRFAMIEAVGSTHGLLACDHGYFQLGRWLQCLTADDVVQFLAPCGPDTAGCAALPVGVGPPMAQDHGPCALRLTYLTAELVQVDGCQGRSPRAFAVFDSAGRVCLSGHFTTAGSLIHIGQLPWGCTIRITDDRASGDGRAEALAAVMYTHREAGA